MVADILVGCAGRVGAKMIGPTIRTWEMAHYLAHQGNNVVCAADEVSDEFDAGTVELMEWPETGRSLNRFYENFKTVILSGNLDSDWFLPGKGNYLKIVDLTAPRILEVTAKKWGDVDPARRYNLHLHREYHRKILRDQVAWADYVLCGNEKQKDFLAGILTAFGKIPDLSGKLPPVEEDRIVVASRGVSPPFPEPETISPFVERFPSIKKSDKVLLWWGGLTEWYKPESLFRALLDISRERSDIKLVMGKPALAAQPGFLPHWFRDFLERSGTGSLLDSTIFFFDDWIDYEDRGRWLSSAYAGVYSQDTGMETRYSDRTRFLDYLWAGLPILVSGGDYFAGLTASEKLGFVVEPNTSQEWKKRIVELCDRPSLREEFSAAARRTRERFRREITLSPLNELVTGTRPRHSRRLADRGSYLVFLLKRFFQVLRGEGLGTALEKTAFHIKKWVGGNPDRV